MYVRSHRLNVAPRHCRSCFWYYWGSGLEEQVKGTGKSKRHAQTFVPNYQASTIEASINTKAPNVFGKAYQPRTLKKIWKFIYP